jgi:hypothetical protein
VIVQVAALGHLLEKGEQQGGIFPNCFELVGSSLLGILSACGCKCEKKQGYASREPTYQSILPWEMRIVQGGRAGTPVSPLATGASTSVLGGAPLLNFATISTSKRMGLWRISGRSNCAKQRKYAENAGILQGLVL